MIWAVCQLVGQAAGAWSVQFSPMVVDENEPQRPISNWYLRGLNLLPVTLAVMKKPWAEAVIWTAMGGAAFWAGRTEAVHRTSRRTAAAVTRWSPSYRVTCRAGAALRILAWPRLRQHGWSAPAMILASSQQVTSDVPFVPRAGDGVLIHGSGPVPRLWEEVCGELTVWPPPEESTWGGFDGRNYLASRGLLWQGKLKRSVESKQSTARPQISEGLLADSAKHLLTPLRDGILERLHHSLPAREASLLAAVLLGQKDWGSSHLREPFQRLGLAHLFAVSGLHVGIVLALVFFAVRPLAPGPKLRFISTTILLSIYVILTGMPSSVLRAAALAMLLTFGPLIGRRMNSLHALAILFWASCQWAPYCIHDIGLRMSYLAAAGIVVLHRIVGPLISDLPRLLRWLLASLTVTIAAQWFTLPEIAASFGWLNPLAPVANLLAVPLFTLAVWMGVVSLVLSLGFVPLAADLSAASWFLLRLLQSGATWLSHSLPTWVGVPTVGPYRCTAFLLISGLLLVALQRVAQFRSNGLSVRRGLIVVVILAGGLVSLLPMGRTCRPGQMTAIQFDVGQGDCGLLVFPDGWSLLIDTGPAWPGGSAWEWSVWPWLVREGIHKLFGVAITHGHADHDGAAPILRDQLQVGQWWCGGEGHMPSQAGSCDRPRPNETLHQCGPWALTCLYAPACTDSLGENDHSLVLALMYRQNMVALWSGDLEAKGESILLRKRLPPPLTRGIVWKSGHHGSATSGSQDFLLRVQPSLIITSCGVENRFGHPSHTPYVVHGDTIPVLRTDLDGSILMQWDQQANFTWRTARTNAKRSLP